MARKNTIAAAYGDRPVIRSIGPFKAVNEEYANQPQDGEGCRDYLEYSENMWRDPALHGYCAISTVPGFRRLIKGSLAGAVHSVSSFLNVKSGAVDVVVHAGDKVYIFPGGDFDAEPFVCNGVSDKRCGILTVSDALWIFDGAEPRYILAAENGGYEIFWADRAYVPTVRRDDSSYEKRNLLTDEVYEEKSCGMADIMRPTKSLTYSLNSRTREARVTGISTCDEILYIPSTVTADGLKYKVTRVAANAFEGNLKIRAAIIGSDVTVALEAFKNCTNLTFVAFETPSGEGTVYIGDRAFYNCPIERLYLGDLAGTESVSLINIGAQAFGGDLAESLESLSADIYYGGSETLFESVAGGEVLCSSGYERLCFGCPYEDKYSFYYVVVGEGEVLSVESVECDGETVPFGCIYRSTTSPQTVRYLIVYLPSEQDISGGRLRIRHTLTPKSVTTSYGSMEYKEAIRRCHIACGFDGRIFLSGNRGIPNTVFFAERVGADEGESLLYFREGDHFDDGVSDLPNVGMIASPSALAVFKSGGGGVYYHRAAGREKREYVSDEGAADVGCLGTGGLAFFGNYPCSLSPLGVFQIRGGASSEKKVRELSKSCRGILESLKRADGENASLCTFEGYLVLCVNGEIYLGDGEALVDDGIPCWYKLCDIGVYDGMTEEYRPADKDALLSHLSVTEDLAGALYVLHNGKYRKLSIPSHTEILDGYARGVTASEVFESAVYSLYENGSYIALGGALTVGVYDGAYCEGDGECLCVSEPTGAMTGGVFDPAVYCASVGNRLIFGTKGGRLCVFNTDKRGREVYTFDLSYGGGKYVTDERLPLCEYTGNGYYYDGEAAELDLYDDETSDTPSGRALCGYADGCYYPICAPETEIEENMLHPYYYSFDGRPIRAFVLTGKDNMGDGGCAKSTVRGSVILSAKSFSGGGFSVRCRTDRQGFFTVARTTASGLDLSSLDFGGTAFSFDGETVYFVLDEKCRDYMWRQYYFGSYGIASPFGISMLSTRFVRRRFRG